MLARLYYDYDEEPQGVMLVTRQAPMSNSEASTESSKSNARLRARKSLEP